MSLAHRSPIVDSIVLNLIRKIHFKKFKFSKEETIDQKIVPTISDSILLRTGFNESSLSIQPMLPISSITMPPFLSPKKENSFKIKEEVQISQKEGIGEFQESIVEREKTSGELPKPKFLKSPNPLMTPKIVKPFPIQRKAMMEKPIQSGIVPINLLQNYPNYGKLNVLIKDPFIEYIDCPGPDKDIFVTKKGQKQQTKITLKKEEIRMLLENISAKTKIPLISGVFRVSWDNFIINAIVSDSVEPRFLIKKNR